MRDEPAWVDTYTRIYRYGVWLLAGVLIDAFMRISVASINVNRMAAGATSIQISNGLVAGTVGVNCVVFTAILMTGWTPLSPLMGFGSPELRR